MVFAQISKWGQPWAKVWFRQGMSASFTPHFMALPFFSLFWALAYEVRTVWEEKPHATKSNMAFTPYNSWKACRMGPPTGKTQRYDVQPITRMFGIQRRVQRCLSYFFQVALHGTFGIFLCSLSIPPSFTLSQVPSHIPVHLVIKDSIFLLWASKPHLLWIFRVSEQWLGTSKLTNFSLAPSEDKWCTIMLDDLLLTKIKIRRIKGNEMNREPILSPKVYGPGYFICMLKENYKGEDSF